MTTTPDGAPSSDTPTDGPAADPTDETTSSSTTDETSSTPDDLTDSPPAVGDLVSYTQVAPWGEQTTVGRVLAVGVPDGGTDTLAIVEWIQTPSGPIDVSVLDTYTPEV